VTSPAVPESDADDFDPEGRELCPDGSCTGLLGDDGRCRVCGRAGEPTLRPAAGALPSDDAPLDATLTPPAGAAPGEGGEDDPFTGRELCPDGSCVGVMGANGRCRECGRPRDQA
jgi:hypothetical protein